MQPNAMRSCRPSSQEYQKPMPYTLIHIYFCRNPMLKRHSKQPQGDHAVYLTLKILFCVERSMPKWNIASRVTSKQSSEKPNRWCLQESHAQQHRQADHSTPPPVQLQLSKEIEEGRCSFGISQSTSWRTKSLTQYWLWSWAAGCWSTSKDETVSKHSHGEMQIR